MYVIQFMIDETGVASSLAKLPEVVDRHFDSLDEGWTCVPLIFRVRGAQEAFSWTFRFEDWPRIIGFRLPIGAASYPSTRRAMYCNYCCRGKAIKYYIFIVCKTCYPACRAHAPYYCHLWFVWQYHYFSYCLLNGTVYGKKVLNIKCVFIFSPQVLFEIFLILRRIERDITINVHRYSYIVPVVVVVVVRFNAA